MSNTTRFVRNREARSGGKFRLNRNLLAHTLAQKKQGQNRNKASVTKIGAFLKGKKGKGTVAGELTVFVDFQQSGFLHTTDLSKFSLTRKYMMRFGPAGVPLCCKERTSLAGITCTADLGLDAMELEFVHGCRMSLENAKICGQAAKKSNVSLSAHASYYLNLLSPESAILERSKKQLEYTAKVMDAAGGGRIAIHSGFYLKLSLAAAYPKMRDAFKGLLEKTEGLNAVFAPEVMGKHSQFGTLEEVFRLSQDLGYDRIRPTIDWGHIHARSNGKTLNTQEDFEAILEYVEKTVGKQGLRTMHCHVEGIEFTERGERRHLPLQEGPPSYKLLIAALKAFKCEGTLICESPLMEKDAALLKKKWRLIQP